MTAKGIFPNGLSTGELRPFSVLSRRAKVKVKYMSELEQICEAAMRTIMEKDVFTKDDFYEHLRGHNLPARQLKDVCNVTFRNFLEVGYIERCIGGYQKAQAEK